MCVLVDVFVRLAYFRFCNPSVVDLWQGVLTNGLINALQTGPHLVEGIGVNAGM